VPVSDFAPRLERAFALAVDDQSCAAAPDGWRENLPAAWHWLSGTAYWNGPARFQRGALPYRHWLDGDGMVLAVRFGADVTVSHRFVRGRKFAAEEEVAAPLFRTFGTGFTGDRLERVGIASPVNVSVYQWAGRLLAYGEQGLPWELDPHTLATVAEFTFGGALNAVSPWSAHPACDRDSGDLFGFGVSFSPAEPCLHFYRFAPAPAPAPPELRFRRRLPLPYPCSIHDFGLSGRHAVFHVAPYLLDVAAVLRDGATVMDALRWEPERGSQLLIADRDSGSEVARLPIAGDYCLHHINAFEDGPHLVVDILELERPVYDQYQVLPDLFHDVSPGRPVRLVIRLHGTGAPRLERRETIAYDRAPDFPVVRPQEAGRPYQDFWALGIAATGRPGRKFFDQLVHLRWERPQEEDLWQAPVGSYLAGEPVIVEGPLGNTALLVPLFDAEAVASSLLVFDAAGVAAGPLLALKLPAPLPPLFHGSFAR
jgi:all-trans-8'-apo-beta-carotenal 15,15'-oxygenase